MDKKKISRLPIGPGVYQFLNQKKEILYIGKAKNIKKRVTQHFQKGKNTPAKNLKMLDQVVTILPVETDNELEALILENTLIKQNQPKYNILLRDDKNFLYLKITVGDPYPQLSLVRRITDRPMGQYFGPYSNAGQIRFSLALVEKIFPYQCLTFFKKGVTKMPCFNYHIKRCPGLCIGAISQQDYRQLIERIIRFFKGDIEEIIRELKEKMLSLSTQHLFEQAAKTRDMIAALEGVAEKQKVLDPNHRLDQDVLGYVTSKNRIYLAILQVRAGKLLRQENLTFQLPNLIEEPGEITEHLLQEYYSLALDIPSQILLPVETTNTAALEEWLSEKRQGKVSILTPVKGRKYALLELSLKNAEAFLERSENAEQSKAGIDPTKGLQQLQKVLKLKSLPRRLECYDISHLGGKFTVASMVVFINGEPAKSQYRQFKMNTIGDNIDDFASMKETLQRRLKYIVNQTIRKLMKNKKESFLQKPDLLILDGGKGQLSMGVEVLEELKLTKKIPICSLAKEEEDIFIPHQSRPIILDKNSQAQYLLERIRDEAHRFAHGFNARLRDIHQTQSSLDQIQGIGASTKKRLLERFENTAGIREASLEDLTNMVGKKLAERIKENL